MIRGHELKRYVRAAAALHELYNDADLGREVGVSRMTVLGWWSGAVPEPGTITRIAEATGLDYRELDDYLNRGGPPPRLVEPDSRAAEAIREGATRDRGTRLP